MKTESDPKPEQPIPQEQKTEKKEPSLLIAFLRYIESFLINIIWGILIKCLVIRIPKFIFDVCKRFLTFIYNLLKNFFSWVFRNFARIIEVMYRTIKIAMLCIVLIAIVIWPLYFHPLFLAAWIIVVVMPGVVWGIMRWRRQLKNKLANDESPAQRDESKPDDTVKELPSPSKENDQISNQ